MVKYLKFSWKEQNNISRKSLIGISFNEDTGFIKIRWLDRSALPATEEILSYVKYYIENEMGRLKEKYLPSHSRIVERYGASNCLDVIIIDFPYNDFEDFGYMAGKIHVSMYKRLNETIIYEGNVWNLIKLLERLQRLIKEADKESFEDITNLEVKEFTPWGESLRIQRKKKIEEINENNFEYEKF